MFKMIQTLRLGRRLGAAANADFEAWAHSLITYYHVPTTNKKIF